MSDNPYQSPQEQGISHNLTAAPLSMKQIMFSMKGRIPRSTYWIYSIVPSIALMIPAFILMSILGEDSLITSLVFLLGYILLVWINICVTGKRWHDRNKSALWILFSLVPLIGPIWSFIECGCLRGTEGPNNFGADPL